MSLQLQHLQVFSTHVHNRGRMGSLSHVDSNTTFLFEGPHCLSCAFSKFFRGRFQTDQSLKCSRMRSNEAPKYSSDFQNMIDRGGNWGDDLFRNSSSRNSNSTPTCESRCVVMFFLYHHAVKHFAKVVAKSACRGVEGCELFVGLRHFVKMSKTWIAKAIIFSLW